MRTSLALAPWALGVVLLAACELDLTGATCNTDENCPVRQFCAVPSGERQGSCQSGERVSAILALGADPSILPAGGSTQAIATLSVQSGPPVPDGGLVTDLVDWSVDPVSEGIISVGNTPGVRGLVQALRPGQGLVLGTMTFSGKQLQASTTVVVSNAALQRLVVVPDRPQYAAGTSGGAAATGFFSDGSHADLTSLVKWTSSAPSVVAVSGASGSWGRLTAATPGWAAIQADYLNVTGSTGVTVSSATLVGLSLSPPTPRGVQGIDLALEATGLFSDGSAQPMTRSVGWSVDDQSVGYFSAPGVVTLLTPGTTTVRAVASVYQASTALDVAPPAPAQLEISPALPDALQLNGTSRLLAWTTHQDGTVCTAAPSWTSVDRTVEVSSVGEISAVQQPGVGTVIATADGLEARAAIEATDAAVEGWQVWPPEQVVPVGAAGVLVFERTLSSGIAQDLTTAAGWRPQNPDAGIDVDTGERGGTVRTRQPGSRLAVLGLMPGGVGRAYVRAPAGVPTLEIVPPESTVPVGGRTRLAAVGHWPDGTVVDVTSSASWSAEPPEVLWAGDGPSAGLIFGADGGVSTLTARFGAATAQAQVEAESAPAALEVWPPGVTLAAGTALPLSVSLVTGSGDSTDVTPDAVWTSSLPRVAIATNAPGQHGTLLGRAPGTAILTTRVDQLEARLPVVVNAATVQEVELHAPPAVVTWAPSSFGATARLSDGTVQDLTGSVSWTLSDPALMRIRGTGGDRGTAVGLDAGMVQVYAHPLGASALNVWVTVNPSAPSSLAVTLPPGGVAAGTRPRVQAVAWTPDGTTVDVTALVEWSSSDPTVATVSSALRPGWVTALRAGSTTVGARFAGLSSSATLQISSDTLTKLTVSAPGTLPQNAGATATATASLSGGGSQVLGEDVVWSSDSPAILAVSNAPGARGQLVALAPGTATVKARTRTGLPSLQASVTVTVSPAALQSPPPGTVKRGGSR
ncbi:MAG TPA: Ig-like domain-containing protein [Myxococcaceae bacterium]|nr:Ig-like domain-containing protein [Myxococcaceae bacterium]